jgi:hypothetical protein
MSHLGFALGKEDVLMAETYIIVIPWKRHTIALARFRCGIIG